MIDLPRFYSQQFSDASDANDCIYRNANKNMHREHSLLYSFQVMGECSNLTNSYKCNQIQEMAIFKIKDFRKLAICNIYFS